MLSQGSAVATPGLILFKSLAIAKLAGKLKQGSAIAELKQMLSQGSAVATPGMILFQSVATAELNKFSLFRRCHSLTKFFPRFGNCQTCRKAQTRFGNRRT